MYPKCSIQKNDFKILLKSKGINYITNRPYSYTEYDYTEKHDPAPEAKAISIITLFLEKAYSALPL